MGETGPQNRLENQHTLYIIMPDSKYILLYVYHIHRNYRPGCLKNLTKRGAC